MRPAASAPAPVLRLASVDSTQAVVFALAEGGAPDRTVVLADHQTAGRGRRGRRWVAAPGTSLLVSILVRPARLPALSLATGVAVAEALAQVGGVPARLKWPNDVLVRGRKIAGILVEVRAGVEPVAAVGIGVNLAQETFPPPLAASATSLRLEVGRTPDRDRVLDAVLGAFDAWRGRLAAEGLPPVLARWRALADTLGRTVTVDGLTGRAVDLDEDGALLIDTPAGRRRVMAGELQVG